MRIITDSRQQRPYQFELASELAALPCGDYSIGGLENYVAVERKTLDDLIGCLTTDRDRFERKLHRGLALDYFALVVEASLSDLVNGRYRTNMLSKSAVQFHKTSTRQKEDDKYKGTTQPIGENLWP